MSTEAPGNTLPRLPDGSVDWARIRLRLHALDAASPDAEEGRARAAALLAQRARDLARPVHARDTRGSLTLVTFGFGSDRYGFDAGAVLAVFRLGSLTLVPGGDTAVVGLTVHHGALLYLVDLRRRLGREDPPLEQLRHVVVVAGSAGSLGVLVEGLGDLLVLDEPLPPPAGGGLLRQVTPAGVRILEVSEVFRGLVASPTRKEQP